MSYPGGTEWEQGAGTTGDQQLVLPPLIGTFKTPPLRLAEGSTLQQAEEGTLDGSFQQSSQEGFRDRTVLGGMGGEDNPNKTAPTSTRKLFPCLPGQLWLSMFKEEVQQKKEKQKQKGGTARGSH